MNKKLLAIAAAVVAVSVLLFSMCSTNEARARCEHQARRNLEEVRRVYPQVKITDKDILFDGEIVYVARYYYGTGYTENRNMYSQVFIYIVGTQDEDLMRIVSNSEFEAAILSVKSGGVEESKQLAAAVRTLMSSPEVRRITNQERQ